MEPASSIIEKLGGAKAVADAVGCHISRVYRWGQPKEAGGTGGAIPHWHHDAIVEAAAGKGITLTEADLVRIGKRAPVEQAKSAGAAQ